MHPKKADRNHRSTQSVFVSSIYHMARLRNFMTQNTPSQAAALCCVAAQIKVVIPGSLRTCLSGVRNGKSVVAGLSNGDVKEARVNLQSEPTKCHAMVAARFFLKAMFQATS